MRSSDRRWVIVVSGTLAAVVAATVLALRALGLGDDSTAAAIAFTGVVLTAAVSVVGLTLTRQQERRLNDESRGEAERLKLDAAMRAGSLMASTATAPATPAAAASGLLALTQLDRADLAVALLVDLWSERPPGEELVSTETAILVLDAALRREQQAATQLVAAELLCRNARRLDACQSLHWPSAIDGGWIPRLPPKAKLLLVDALVRMTCTTTPSENALRSISVRLFGIYRSDNFPHVRGCIAVLISSLLPALEGLGYTTFMQGNVEVSLKDLQEAAGHAEANPDEMLARLVLELAKTLRDWSGGCQRLETGPGSLATAVSGS